MIRVYLPSDEEISANIEWRWPEVRIGHLAALTPDGWEARVFMVLADEQGVSYFGLPVESARLFAESLLDNAAAADEAELP